MTDPADPTPALAEQPAPPDFPALFLQASAKVAELAAERRIALGVLPAEREGESLLDRLRRVAGVLKATRAMLAEQAQTLLAVNMERAHLRQELETARTSVAAGDRDQAAAARTRRLFLEGLRGQPYEREVRELLERCEAKATRQGS